MSAMQARALRIAGLLLTCLWAAPAAAGPRLDATAALEKSEAAIGRMIGGHRLVGSDGSAFTFARLRGRPLVISLIYTSCSSVCPVTTQKLKSAVALARGALGRDAFSVLTLGFDARNDSPLRMAAFAADHDIDADPFWFVASGSPAVLESLLEEVGFSYSAAAGGFEHVAQTTILDADGRVYRHVYGDDFPVQVFIEPLKALVFGDTMRSFSPVGLADRLRFLCTVYDPKTGRYRTDYAIYIGVGTGGLSLVLMAWVIVRMWRGNRRFARAGSGS